MKTLAALFLLPCFPYLPLRKIIPRNARGLPGSTTCPFIRRRPMA